MNKNIKDLTGQTFKNLLVLEISNQYTPKKVKWKCKCLLCGTIKDFLTSNLKRIESCGCLKKQQMQIEKATHGFCRNNKVTPEYRAWCQAKTRCYNANSPDYKYYGGRGIKMSEVWVDSPETFVKDMGLRPTNKYTLERVNVNGDYEPENCIWTLNKNQPRNQTRTVLSLELAEKIRQDKKEGMRIIEIANKYNLGKSAIAHVVHNRAWKGEFE